MENILAYERKDYIRMGAKDQLMVGSDTSYTKRVQEDYKRVVKLYNSKNEFISLDVVKVGETIEKVISVKSTGLTVVIVKIDDVEYKGKAQCHEGDLFRVQTGYEIARARAMIKYNECKIAKYI